jgi:hypothetical protein
LAFEARDFVETSGAEQVVEAATTFLLFPVRDEVLGTRCKTEHVLQFLPCLTPLKYREMSIMEQPPIGATRTIYDEVRYVAENLSRM